jgi:hypothetical protein
MSDSIGTIRQFRTKRFRVIVDAVADDSCLDDLHSEPEDQQEIADNLDSGKWVLFTVRARAFLDGNEIASDYLGGCIYSSIAEFQDHRQCAAETRRERAKGRADVVVGSYFADMVRNVCTQARATLHDYQSIYIR